MRAESRDDAVSAAIVRMGIDEMTQDEAETIADWHYDGPYSFYDARSDESDLTELIDPDRRGGSYFSARDEAEELVGFFQFRPHGDAVVVGLGLRPDLTGRGLGLSFLEAGLAFARKRYAPRRFRLSVATFNRRAITVYERAGFALTRSYLHETNGGLHPFFEMEREA